MDVADVPGVPAWFAEDLRADGIESLYPPQQEAVEADVTDGESLVASIPTADSIASCATSVFPLAVGMEATRLSPSVTSASTASCWGGYSDSIPSARRSSANHAGTPGTSTTSITGR